MTDRYAEFQRALSDPEFWETDRFQVAHDLMGALTADDWVLVDAEASHASSEWWERFLVSASGVRSAAALSLSLRLMSSDSHDLGVRGVALLNACHPDVGRSMDAAELRRLGDVWSNHSDWRRPIAQAAWRLGRSRELRNHLGLQSWAQLSGAETSS